MTNCEPGRGAYDPPLPRDIVCRVVRTTSPEGQASGFVIEVAGELHLVTAAEVVGERTTRLLVTLEGANRMLHVAHLGNAGGDRIAVCRILSGPEIRPLERCEGPCIPGASQAVFSVGFLRGVRGLGAAANVPFVLRGTVSAVASGADGPVLYVDGSFNPGMVGGPSLCLMPAGGPPRVVGVTLGRQPIETKGAGGVLSPVGEEKDPAVDTSVVAVLGISVLVDLIGFAKPT